MQMGLLSGASSLSVYEKRHEACAANLANLSTPGYRRRVEILELREMGEGSGAHGKVRVPRFTMGCDFTPGDLRYTERDLDLAIEDTADRDGNAFFALETPAGEAYTRNGSMALDGQGRLVHAASGHAMRTDNGGEVRLLPGGGELRIDRQGRVSQGQISLGQLKLVRFGRLHDLEPIGEGLYRTLPDNPVESALGRAEVRQGYVELSNASPVDELVKMVANYRAYEASQRILRQMDQSLTRLIRQTSA